MFQYLGSLASTSMNVLCTYLWPETTYFSFALDSAVIGASKAAKKEPNFFVKSES